MECQRRYSVVAWPHLQRPLVLGESVSHDVEQEAHQVGHHGDEENELCELGRTPCALQIASSVEDGEASRHQTQHVLLDGGRKQENPRVDDRDAGDDGQVGHTIAHSSYRLRSAFGPARGRAQGEVEQCKEHERREQATGQGRQVDASHGGGTEGCMRCESARATWEQAVGACGWQSLRMTDDRAWGVMWCALGWGVVWSKPSWRAGGR